MPIHVQTPEGVYYQAWLTEHDWVYFYPLEYTEELRKAGKIRGYYMAYLMSHSFKRQIEMTDADINSTPVHYISIDGKDCWLDPYEETERGEE